MNWELLRDRLRGRNRKDPLYVSPPTIWRLTASMPGLPYLVLITAITVAAGFFLVPAQQEFPMDDAYIHFVYAENVASQRELVFSDGAEAGLGVTSPLWVLLLSAGVALGLPISAVARFLGLAALIVVSCLLYRLTAGVWPRWVALGAGLLVALSGNLFWFALSGMETMLFLALGLTALWLYRSQRPAWLGFVLGLLALTRPEGLALAGVIGLLELLRQRRWTRELGITALICLLTCGPWFFYLFWRTGGLLPTSAIGKQLSFQAAIRLVSERNPWLAGLARFPPAVYGAAWMSYLLLFALGGMALPAPYVPVGAILDNPNYALSVWAVAGWALVVLPLSLVAARRLVMPRQWATTLQDPAHRALLALALWGVAHNVSYMAFMPVPGTASRYGALNYILLWLTLMIGLHAWYRRTRHARWFGLGLALLVLANLVYWRSVYDANIVHMQEVRLAAAAYLRQELPADERCAVFDIGAMRYASRRPIVDLGGLIDPGAPRHYLAGTYDQYLLDQGATCLILPGRMNTGQEGWFDMAHALGFANSSRFDLEEVAVFEIEQDVWLHGYLPTNNYQASVVIYRVVPTS